MHSQVRIPCIALCLLHKRYIVTASFPMPPTATSLLVRPHALHPPRPRRTFTLASAIRGCSTRRPSLCASNSCRVIVISCMMHMLVRRAPPLHDQSHRTPDIVPLHCTTSLIVLLTARPVPSCSSQAGRLHNILDNLDRMLDGGQAVPPPALPPQGPLPSIEHTLSLALQPSIISVPSYRLSCCAVPPPAGTFWSCALREK